MTCPWLHWTTDNLSGMHMVSISTPVCVNFELRPGAGDIHICWFNFDALAQGNAYKPTKEPINYRGPGGDRTHDLQTEATPPAASCPARTLHATEIAPKNATPMTCPWLHWTTDNLSGMHMVSISTPVCVNFELRPGAGDINICWFNFDALAQGNAYKPTKERFDITWLSWNAIRLFLTKCQTATSGDKLPYQGNSMQQMSYPLLTNHFGLPQTRSKS